MWGAPLMCQGAVKSFGGIAALRVLSGALEAIADPAFMLITSMYYTRAEQPSRIAAWYVFNGVGVAGGGLIGECFPDLTLRQIVHCASMPMRVTKVTASVISNQH